MINDSRAVVITRGIYFTIYKSSKFANTYCTVLYCFKVIQDKSFSEKPEMMYLEAHKNT